MSHEYVPTFTCFPNLPLELRRMIWRNTLPGPRVVYAAPRKLKGGKCSRVWSDCINDEEGNEHFFDLQLNGQVIHVGGWITVDGVPSRGMVVRDGDNNLRLDDDEVFSQQEEEGYSPPNVDEDGLERGNNETVEKQLTAEKTSDFDALDGFSDPGNFSYGNSNPQLLNEIDQSELVEVHEPGPTQLWGMRSAELKSIITLLICKESYQVAIDEKYTQAFGSLGCMSTIWFSYKHDTLYMEPEYFEIGCTPEDLGYDNALVRRLALGHSKKSDFTWYESRLWDAEMLSWFGNVKEFTFAATSEWDRVLLDDCALMDLAVALDTNDPRMKMFEMGYCPERARKFAPTIEQMNRKHEALLETDISDLDFKRRELGEIMRRGIAMGDWDYIQMNPNFTMPKFQRQAIVTTEQKAKFDRAMEEYEKQKMAYRMKLNISSPGKEELPCVVSSETTLADIWELFASSNGISPGMDVKLNCCNTEGGGFEGLLPRSDLLLFELAGVVDGCAIIIEIGASSEQ